MGLLKTVGLVILAGAAGSMIADRATPKLMELTKLDGKHGAAVRTGVTAGGAALVYVVFSSVI